MIWLIDSYSMLFKWIRIWCVVCFSINYHLIHRSVNHFRWISTHHLPIQNLYYLMHWFIHRMRPLSETIEPCNNWINECLSSNSIVIGYVIQIVMKWKVETDRRWSSWCLEELGGRNGWRARSRTSGSHGRRSPRRDPLRSARNSPTVCPVIPNKFRYNKAKQNMFNAAFQSAFIWHLFNIIINNHVCEYHLLAPTTHLMPSIQAQYRIYFPSLLSCLDW